jgi:tripartite-type tricarboxylate transporter receptor subunit TctC
MNCMLASCALLFALGALFPAKAQQYPSQALRIIVTFPREPAPMDRPWLSKT